MTREEAAQLLWRVAYDKYGPDDNPMRQREAADIVVTALRESKRRAEGCTHCRWIDPALANDGVRYCSRCGRQIPHQDNDKTHIG